jgi:hypothetical protein
MKGYTFYDADLAELICKLRNRPLVFEGTLMFYAGQSGIPALHKTIIIIKKRSAIFSTSPRQVIRDVVKQ